MCWFADATVDASLLIRVLAQALRDISLSKFIFSGLTRFWPKGSLIFLVNRTRHRRPVDASDARCAPSTNTLHFEGASGSKRQANG
jgi:hypothetical protein